MGWLVGTDEAGYGPKLGPLVIVATVWHVPESSLDELCGVDLYQRFKEATVRPKSKPTTKQQAGKTERIAVGDSKALYASGDPLTLLETAAIAFFEAGTNNRACETFSKWLQELPCRDWSPPPSAKLPVDAELDQLTRATARIGREFEQTGSRLANVAAKVVYPPTFNDGCRQAGNKATFLSQTTLQLAATALAEAQAKLGEAEALILCDKHGGRGSYGALLPQAFTELRNVPEWKFRESALAAAGHSARGLFESEQLEKEPDLGGMQVETLLESREQSRYRWRGPKAPPREIRFSAKGESEFPTALASIYAKLLRELAMRSFNAYWSQHIEGLRPTAGYAVDADRFLKDIEAARAQLGIDHQHFVRER
jgi:hypothetical protein